MPEKQAVAGIADVIAPRVERTLIVGPVATLRTTRQ